MATGLTKCTGSPPRAPGTSQLSVPAENRLAERSQHGGEHRRGRSEQKTLVKARNNFRVPLEIIRLRNPSPLQRCWQIRSDSGTTVPSMKLGHVLISAAHGRFLSQLPQCRQRKKAVGCGCGKLLVPGTHARRHTLFGGFQVPWNFLRVVRGPLPLPVPKASARPNWNIKCKTLLPF